MRRLGIFVGTVVLAGSVAVAAPQVATHASTVHAGAAPLPQVDVGSVSVQEGDVGSILVHVPVTLSAPAPAKVTMNYTVTAGTAGSADFLAKHGKLSFPALKIVERQVVVKVNGDTTPESNETVVVTVSAVVGATVHSGSGVLTIVDDDTHTASGAHARAMSTTPDIALGSATMYEGDDAPRNALVPITLSEPADTPVTVQLSTGCDTTGADIVPLIKKVTFPIGTRIKMIPVKVLPNTQPAATDTMPDQAIRVNGAALVDDGSGQIDVLDDDGYVPLPVGTPTPPPPGIMRVSEAPGGQDPTFPDSVRDEYACKGGKPASKNPMVTDDGRYVSFESTADNLVPGDTNGVSDVFMRDTSTDQVERINVAADGTQSDGQSFSALMTPDGRYVVFGSAADNLVPGVSGQPYYAYYVVDRQQHTIGAIAPGDRVESPSISDNGRYVAFSSALPLVGDTDPPGDRTEDVYVLDRTTGHITLISKRANGHGSWGQWPRISGDGNTIVWDSEDTGIVAGDPGATAESPDRLYATDRVTGTTDEIGLTSSGAGLVGFGVDPLTESISYDGRDVAFTADVCNLGVPCFPDDPTNPDDHAGLFEGYVRDRVAHTTTLATIEPPSSLAGVQMVMDVSLSEDGRYLVYTREDLAIQSCGSDVLFRRDLQTGVEQPISQANGADCNGGSPEIPSYGGLRAVSSGGRYVVFGSLAGDLIGTDANGNPNDGDDAYDVFLVDLG